VEFLLITIAAHLIVFSGACLITQARKTFRS
jgi:hypothetical protein